MTGLKHRLAGLGKEEKGNWINGKKNQKREKSKKENNII